MRRGLRTAFLLCAALVAAQTGRADLVTTHNGAQIVGRIAALEDGRITVVTSYAGEIKVLLTAVRSLSTSQPLNVRLADGTQVEGTVSGGAGGALVVVTPIRTIDTRVADLRGLFPATASRSNDPAQSPPRWSYEVGINASGRSGNQEQVGAAFSARASRVSARDNLSLRANYDRQSTSGVKSADQLKTGLDYQRNLAARSMWYARDDAGYDNVRDLEFYAIAAGGLGYDLVKRTALRLTVRGGLSYRYEDFGNPATDDVATLGADLGLANVWQIKGTSLVSRITYVQGFDAATTYRIQHESYYEMPMTLDHFRVRLGLTHDYNTRVGTATAKLDTSYFVQLLMSWQ